jgi:hypothetical protein
MATTRKNRRPEGFEEFARIHGGAKAVIAVNAEGAKAFAEGSTGRFEIRQLGSSGDIGFWTGVQRRRG